MTQSNIRIEGLDRLATKLRNLEQLEGIIGVMRAAAVHVKGKIAKYPDRDPGAEAKAAGARSWYERNYGWRYRSGGGNPVSEQLGKHWATEAGQRGNGFFAEVGTNVSYADDVQGPGQLPKFAEIGWKTTDTVVSEERNTIVTMLRDKINQILSR